MIIILGLLFIVIISTIIVKISIDNQRLYERLTFSDYDRDEGYKNYNKYKNKSRIFEIMHGVFVTIACVAGFFLILSLLFLVCFHIGVNNKKELLKIEHDGLVKRLEIIDSNYEDVSKSDVIKDITEWNKRVQTTKYLYNSPFTNWFHPKEVVDCYEYIEIK